MQFQSDKQLTIDVYASEIKRLESLCAKERAAMTNGHETRIAKAEAEIQRLQREIALIESQPF